MEKDKIYIVGGNILNNGENFDGEFITIKGDDDTPHAVYISEFLEDNYNDISILKKMNPRIHVETISHFLSVTTNSIIFLNTTKDIQSHGRTGFFIMPPIMTEKQIKVLEEIAEKLSDFRNIAISYDSEYRDGIIYDSSMTTNGQLKPAELIAKYLEIYYEKQNNKTR